MVRFRPSAARARAAATPTARLSTPSDTARISLRSRFRHAKPIVARRLSNGNRPGIAPSIGYVRFSIPFSSGDSDFDLTESKIGPALLERWAYIDAGMVPPDDDEAPRVMTPEEAEEREADLIADIENDARMREQTIRENAHDEAEYHRKLAAEYMEDAIKNPMMALRAEAEMEEANDVLRDAEKQIENIADDVREERQQIRRDLEREYSAQQEELSEYIAGLKSGLNGEVTREIIAWFQKDGHNNNLSSDSITEWYFVS